MKISELIARLEDCKAEHGDVEVYTRDFGDCDCEGVVVNHYFEVEDVWEFRDEAAGELRLTVE